MLTKIYFFTWGLVGIAAAGLYLAGYFNQITLVIFGFIAFGLVFMGMMGVLPATIAHPSVNLPSADEMRARPQKEHIRHSDTQRKRFAAIKSV